jgi:hypothetical protein
MMIYDDPQISFAKQNARRPSVLEKAQNTQLGGLVV